MFIEERNINPKQFIFYDYSKTHFNDLKLS